MMTKVLMVIQLSIQRVNSLILHILFNICSIAEYQWICPINLKYMVFKPIKSNTSVFLTDFLGRTEIRIADIYAETARRTDQLGLHSVQA